MEVDQAAAEAVRAITRLCELGPTGVHVLQVQHAYSQLTSAQPPIHRPLCLTSLSRELLVLLFAFCDPRTLGMLEQTAKGFNADSTPGAVHDAVRLRLKQQFGGSAELCVPTWPQLLYTREAIVEWHQEDPQESTDSRRLAWQRVVQQGAAATVLAEEHTFNKVYHTCLYLSLRIRTHPDVCGDTATWLEGLLELVESTGDLCHGPTSGVRAMLRAGLVPALVEQLLSGTDECRLLCMYVPCCPPHSRPNLACAKRAVGVCLLLLVKGSLAGAQLLPCLPCVARTVQAATPQLFWQLG